MSGGIGGIFNSLANIGDTIGTASPFWLPINFGRKKRNVEGDEDLKVSNRDVFKNFVLFQQRMKAMNPKKFKEIVKEVVKSVVNNDTAEVSENDKTADMYDELIAKQISELLLKPRLKPRKQPIRQEVISNDILDSSVSYL